MQYLTSEQIDAIDAELKNAEINYSHLPEDLLDHICCDIEKYLNDGLNFNEAYQSVFDKIGINGLKEIQEATIFYVKLNLMKMKKLMNFMALIGGISVTAGMFFKLMHWPGGGIVLTFGFLFLFLGFFPAALMNLRKELEQKFFSAGFLIYLVGFLTFVITGAAMIFKMMHWPGGGLLVSASMILLFLIFFPVLFFKIVRTEKNRIVNLSLVLFAFLFAGFITVSNLNSARNVSNVFQYEDLTAELAYYKEAMKTQASSTVFSEAEYTASLKLFNTLNTDIEDLKSLILNDRKDIYELNFRLNHFSLLEDVYDSRLIALKEEIEAYKQQMLKLAGNSKDLSILINALFNTEDYQLEYYHRPWIERKFDRSYVGKLTSLQQLQKYIYQTQYEVLRYQVLNSSTPE